MTLFSLLILWISSSTVFQIPYFYEKTAISCTVVLQIQRIIFLLLLRDFVFALVFCSFYYHGSRRGSLHIYSTQWSSSFLDYTLFFHQTQQFMVIIFPKKSPPFLFLHSSWTTVISRLIGLTSFYRSLSLCSLFFNLIFFLFFRLDNFY